MRGTTHAAIGIAVANAIQQSAVSDFMRNPAALIPIVAAYAGAIFCDIDLENSMISNKLFFLKSRTLRQLITTVFVGSLIAAVIQFQHTSYFPFVMAFFVICLMSLTKITRGVLSIVKKTVLIGTAAVILLAGLVERQPPLMLAGAVMLVFILSPHRGYSHSLLGIVVCTAVAKYFCVYYGLMEVSLYFGLGMLSHVAADMFTNQGVVLLFPYPRRIKFPVTIATGSPIEYLVILGTMLLFGVWGV